MPDLSGGLSAGSGLGISFPILGISVLSVVMKNWYLLHVCERMCSYHGLCLSVSKTLLTKTKKYITSVSKPIRLCVGMTTVLILTVTAL